MYFEFYTEFCPSKRTALNFLTKIKILWQILLFLTKIKILWQIILFLTKIKILWQIILFLTKIKIVWQIILFLTMIFVKVFDLCQSFRFLLKFRLFPKCHLISFPKQFLFFFIKISIFTKISIFIKISIFHQNFHFFKKIFTKNPI